VIERNLADRYRLEGQIGQGGMAIVYAGVDTVLRRRVAIKVLRPQLAADAEFVRRFYSEAQHAAKLSHPNIVNIYDVGREGDSYFIVMELVEGATLAEMIEHDVRLPEAVTIDFAAQICNGLAYAHRQGLLHRDVKPANILVTKDDVVKISDFGIARAVSSQTMTVTQPGMVMGSVFYLSPEQAQGHELDQTSDLYSLGIVLYQMLTGKLPYTGDSPITVALKHVSSPVPVVDIDDLSVSPALAAIVHKLLQKNPLERFASAVEVGKALREAREHPLVTVALETSLNGHADTRARPKVIPVPKPRPAKHPDRSVSTTGVDVAPDEKKKARALTPLARFGLPLLFAAAMIAAILGGYLSSRPGAWLGGPAVVTVAAVTGDTLENAEAKLDTLGLRYSVVSVPSETVAADHVLRQNPVPNARVGAHSVVMLDVSSGLPTVALIDMRHYSREDAERYLRDAKLAPKFVETFNASPRGTVLAQRPPSGTAVPIHSTVALTISKGLKPVVVPDVTSEVVGDATSELRGRNLTLAISERDQSDQIAAGVVLSQTPAAGTPVDPGSTVSVTVSAGAPQLVVPDVGGRSAADATSALEDAGLQTNLEYVVDASANAGTVLKQNPDKGVQIKKGSTVTLSVVVAGTVPDVSGKSPADAQTILENAGYKVGNLAYVQEGTEGTVARTEPAATTPLRPGETVMLFVSGVSPSNQ
jgi:beta-lactam-binding protein with PASTA domain/tRNA A-37 threonylcarbamoyl transferase component Bud32